MARKITLSDGKQIPALGYGSGSGGFFQNDAESAKWNAIALKAGILHLDTAQVYETEPAAGQAIKDVGLDKDQVWVTTKLSTNRVSATTRDIIRGAVKDSIAKLTFKPDLFLIHNPFVIEKGKLGEAWKILEELVEDGTLAGTSLGVSNFRPQDLEDVLAVAKIKPVVNQLEYHPYVLNHLDPVLAIHKAHDIKVQAYGPLTPLLRHKTGGPIKPILEQIAQRLSKDTGKDVDAAAVLLLWNLKHDVIPISTSSNEGRIKKLAEIDSLPDITDEEFEQITQAGRKIYFRHYTEHMTEDFPEPDLPKDI